MHACRDRNKFICMHTHELVKFDATCLDERLKRLESMILSTQTD